FRSQICNGCSYLELFLKHLCPPTSDWVVSIDLLAVVMVPEPWKHEECTVESHKQFWIRPLLAIKRRFETTAINAGDCNTTETSCQDVRNGDAQKIPGGRIVACPQAGVTGHTGERSTTDNEIAFARSVRLTVRT